MLVAEMGGRRCWCDHWCCCWPPSLPSVYQGNLVCNVMYFITAPHSDWVMAPVMNASPRPPGPAPTPIPSSLLASIHCWRGIGFGPHLESRWIATLGSLPHKYQPALPQTWPVMLLFGAELVTWWCMVESTPVLPAIPSPHIQNTIYFCAARECRATTSPQSRWVG